MIQKQPIFSYAAATEKSHFGIGSSFDIYVVNKVYEACPCCGIRPGPVRVAKFEKLTEAIEYADFKNKESNHENEKY